MLCIPARYLLFDLFLLSNTNQNVGNFCIFRKMNFLCLLYIENGYKNTFSLVDFKKLYRIKVMAFNFKACLVR